MTSSAKASALLLLAFSTHGCISWSGGIIAATTPVNSAYEVLGPAKARVCMDALFGFIPFSSPPKTEAALKKALASHPGADALIDATVDSFWATYLVMTSNCISVSGTAVRFTKAANR